MKTRFIGDVHVKWLDYLNVIHNPKNLCSRSIQVGDFGIGFGQRQEFVDYLTEKMNKENHSHRFIRGNHDNVSVAKHHKNFIQDGTIEDGMMFVGGAFSIDKDLRTPGLDWWDDEELSYTELAEMIVRYEEEKPEIMITHDCPNSVAQHLFSNHIKHEFENSRTRTAFDTMFHHVDHKPKLWIFGHWHTSKHVNILGTDFICLNELEFIDLDI